MQKRKTTILSAKRDEIHDWMVDAHIKYQDSNGESGDEVEAEEEVDEEAQ